MGVCIGAGIPLSSAPSSTIHHDKKYYNLSTFQNNQEGSFDKYFINMDNAELRKGEFIFLFCFLMNFLNFVT